MGELHLIVDSTRLKSRGAGEWLFEKHGTAKRRSWRKLHIGIDADSGEIVAFDLTSGYNRRSKVEAAISRYKRVVGEALKSRDDARRVTDVAIAIKSLNRMSELGQANFVRVA